MEWNIVADSGCDLRGIKLGDKKIKITKIPFSIFVENIEYMDNPRFNVGDMSAPDREAGYPYPHSLSVSGGLERGL